MEPRIVMLALQTGKRNTTTIVVESRQVITLSEPLICCFTSTSKVLSSVLQYPLDPCFRLSMDIQSFLR